MKNLRTWGLLIVGSIILYCSTVLKGWYNSNFWSDTGKYLVVEIAILGVVLFMAIFENARINRNFFNLTLIAALFISILFGFENTSAFIIINLVVYIIRLIVENRILFFALKKVTLYAVAQNLALQNYHRRGRA